MLAGGMLCTGFPRLIDTVPTIQPGLELQDLDHPKQVVVWRDLVIWKNQPRQWLSSLSRAKGGGFDFQLLRWSAAVARSESIATASNYVLPLASNRK
jgi:hypothetical protein